MQQPAGFHPVKKKKNFQMLFFYKKKKLCPQTKLTNKSKIAKRLRDFYRKKQKRCNLDPIFLIICLIICFVTFSQIKLPKPFFYLPKVFHFFFFGGEGGKICRYMYDKHIFANFTYIVCTNLYFTTQITEKCNQFDVLDLIY